MPDVNGGVTLETLADGVTLERPPDGLALRTPAGLVVRAAAERLAGPRLKGRDLLGKATFAREGGDPVSVVDATAGLGADGFHLAALGHAVTLIEREPLIHALLADTLARALAGALGPRAEAAARRVTLHLVDARVYLATAERAQVVYLDPMFPERGKTALPGKAMALFREQLHPREAREAEEAGLLLAARRHAARRVVVKRPLRAPPLGGVAPSGALSGTTVRFDLYAALVQGAGRG